MLLVWYYFASLLLSAPSILHGAAGTILRHPILHISDMLIVWYYSASLLLSAHIFYMVLLVLFCFFWSSVPSILDVSHVLMLLFHFSLSITSNNDCQFCLLASDQVLHTLKHSLSTLALNNIHTILNHVPASKVIHNNYHKQGWSVLLLVWQR